VVLSSPVPVGLNVWSRLVEATFPYLDRTAAPFDSLWFPDHVQYSGHKVAEGWTLLAYALARYPDKICTHEVLSNSFRNPAHLAKMVATAHAISGGRVILGIGAGWNEEEYRAYGWPYPPTRVRIAQLAEAIELIRAMWTQAPASYHGEHYQIAGAYCEPRPSPFRGSWWAGTASATSSAWSRSTRMAGTIPTAITRPTSTSRRS
jgi:alkanesulfonate monooxygenase SsuD/methylene tetrahydromethanopterin reductase-like flavin-dependent oxidoreductase (luciferase family)